MNKLEGRVQRWILALFAVSLFLQADIGLAARPGNIFGPAPIANPVPVPPQFDITGFIQSATLDTAGTSVCTPKEARLAGGTMTVNGILITVPCNTVLQMPATSLTWADLYNGALAPLLATKPPALTGLALTDNPMPALPTFPGSTTPSPDAPTGYNGQLPSYEVHVQGNVVDGKYIAGLIFISQQGLNLGFGTITAIDYATATITVSTKGGTVDPVTGVVTFPKPDPTAVRIRLNDPIGRFGKVHAAPGACPGGTTAGVSCVEDFGFDPRFTADTDNPTIRTVTGYPVCVPRLDPAVQGDDPGCTQANRPIAPNCPSLGTVNGIAFPAFVTPPNGAYCHTWVMSPVTTSSGVPVPVGQTCPLGINPATCPMDPRVMAPLEVGDVINYSGTLKVDPVTGPYISAHTVVANLGIYTTPGTKPSYVVIEVLEAATSALPIANLPQEQTSKVRVEGFATDPANLVDIYAMDVDPLTGAVSDRYLGSESPSGPPVIGRFRLRPNAGPFLPVTRNYRVLSRDVCATAAVPFPAAICAFPRNAKGETVTPAPEPGSGLVTMQYNAPNFTYIFPENLVIGDPIVPADLQDLPFLWCGSGPVGATGVASVTLDPITGVTTAVTPSVAASANPAARLDPGPWKAPMPTPTFNFAPYVVGGVLNAGCQGTVGGTAASIAPVADAGAPQTVTAGTTVALNATLSTGSTPLTFAWVQVDPVTGLPVVPATITLTGANTATPTFVAPNVAAPTNFAFTVTVSNAVGSSTSAPVIITVNPAVAAAPVLSAANQSVVSGAAVTLTGNCTANCTGVTFQWTQTAGPAVTLSATTTTGVTATTGTGTATFTAPVGPTTLTFRLAASVGGVVRATTNATVTVIPGDTVNIVSVQWDNRKLRGKLTVNATTTSTSATLSVAQVSAVVNGVTIFAVSPASPIAMTRVANNVCGAGNVLPCWQFAPVSGVIQSNGAFVPPDFVQVISNQGGSAAAPPPPFIIRQ